VDAKKTVLIVTDGAGSTAKIAESLAAVLTGNNVTIRAAADFAGTDLLPADAFFIGCEAPKPASFGYLTELLQHINLSGRPCGVFSSGSEKAARYLARLLKDSEAALYPEPCPAGRVLKAWAAKVIAKE
jgi:menaquinone-dependent protoporphyrinogen IX oxidase